MSKSAANILERFINAVILPTSRRQQKRIIARLINNLEKNSLSEVKTKRGLLRLLALKSGVTASAIERFHEDEPEMLDWIDTFKDGDVFWDVGANIGLFSLYAALNKNIRVYSFEPSGLNFGLLIQHISINGLDKNINPYCFALGKDIGPGTLFMKKFEQGHASNTFVETGSPASPPVASFEQSTVSFTVDHLVKRLGMAAPDHIKIDVDGIEPEILSGAKETLPRIKSIMIEVEGRNLEMFDSTIESPLGDAGLTEDVSVRKMGHKRNRLFVRY